MADQYTRITCGGSPLDVSFPVTGLLFGMVGDPLNQKKTAAQTSEHADHDIRILDADDIPTDSSEGATIVVNLHQAVFPAHKVMGWYRVSATEEGPVANDLLLTRQLQQHYKNHGHEKEEDTDTAVTDAAATTSADTDIDTPFLFALLQVPSATTAAKAAKDKADSESDKDEELPLTLYQLFDPAAPSGSAAATSAENMNAVLIGLDDWKLATSEPERIAVERVVREQPQESAGANMAATYNGPVHSKYVTKTASLQHSLQAIQERLAVLAHFLEETAAGKIPPNHSLLRQVQGLMCQLGPIAAAKNTLAHSVVPATTTSTTTTADLDDSSNLLQQLAILGKTVDAVTGYTEKFRVVHETSSRPATVGRERRDMTSRLML
jgi:hypothetical protein